MMFQFLKTMEISRSADPDPGDKVVQMNIDGVDASVSGITECPVPASLAEIALPGEVRAEPGVDDGVTVGSMRNLVNTRKNPCETLVKEI
jgi:hypothetical protein